MGHEIDLSKYAIRTDLVLETIENSREKIKTETTLYGNIKVTTIEVDKATSKLINKKEGTYITIEFADATDTENQNAIEEVLINKLHHLLSKLSISDDASVLIIGLGNEKSTPDSLGPKTLENIVVTRHLFTLGEPVSKGIREVSAIRPSVMADTGIETSDIITSITNKIKPSFIIVIDALAASSISRINRSIQLTDTGIHPGSGVGNMRKEISKDTLGIPVISIGIPTVVESSTIVYDTIDYLFKHISYIKENPNKNKLVFTRSHYLDKIKNHSLSREDKQNILGLIGTLTDSDKRSLINEVLDSVNYNLIVTPKEVDFQIAKLSSILSSGINRALHKKCVK